MPVKKQGDKFYVNNTEYDTEDKANAAYQAYITKAMGIAEDKKKSVKKSKPKTKKKIDGEDEDTWDIRHFGHD